jgi:hypothetical protein
MLSVRQSRPSGAACGGGPVAQSLLSDFCIPFPCSDAAFAVVANSAGSPLRSAGMTSPTNLMRSYIAKM